MKYSTIAVTFAAFAVGVVAQGLGDIPPCPRGCIFGGTAKTECSLTDIPCSCRDLSYQAQLAECMAKCPPEEAAKGAQVGAAICKAAGVEISIPSVTSTVSVPPSTSSVTVEEPETSSAVVTSTTTTSATSVETPVETPVEEDDDEEEDTDATTTAVIPTTTLISSTIATGGPAPTGNSTTNGTVIVTPPTATPIPPTQGEDSGAGQIAVGSMFGVVVMGAVAFAL